jgi:hypothetical protein
VWPSDCASTFSPGTPLQNDLNELKTLLSFLEPGIFGAAGERLDELEVETLPAYIWKSNES